MAFPLPLPFLLDGATGTQLQKRGMPIGFCTERWVLEHPDDVIDFQIEYLHAGSGAVYAPTFGCNRPTLKKYGLENRVREYCLELVAVSRKAVQKSGKSALIGGDISPCGLYIEPLGENRFEDVVAVFTEQAAALDEAGVDFFAVETQLSLIEAQAAVTGIHAVSDKPILVTFSCNNQGLSFWGENLADIAVELEELGIDSFGINCCGDLTLLTNILREISEKTSLPLIAKPNAGIPRIENDVMRYDMSPGELAAAIPGLYEAGARFFGGCCGTTAAHIAAISEALRGL